MINPKVKKCVDIMRDRVYGVSNDLKSFIYIRNNNLQSKEDNLGGGNTVGALSLFTALSFLGKCYYCVERPDKFMDDGCTKDESAAFIAFVRFLQSKGVDLSLPDNGGVLLLVWNGFRNFLAHRLKVEDGKQVLTFVFDEPMDGTIEDILKKAGTHPVFEHDGSERNWTINGDSLLSKLMEITDLTEKYILAKDSLDVDLLVKVVDIRVD